MRRREVMAGIGGAAAWPIAAVGQPSKTPLIGFLSAGTAAFQAPQIAGFRRGLEDEGYVEGTTARIEIRLAEGHYDRLPAMAADLVAHQVDVIAATGGDVAIVAAKSATSTIPIVFTIGDDPVSAGFVPNLARPGGNLTGVSFLLSDLDPKRFELLREMVPQAGTIALLVNPKNLRTGRLVLQMQEVAHSTGVQLHVAEASSEAEIETAFAALTARRAGGLVVDGDSFLIGRMDQILALAARHAVPAVYPFATSAASGGLLSYGPSLPSVYRQAGVYVGRILKGAKPADLPILQPITFELIINLKTAKALGLAVPQSLVGRADAVIE